MAPARSPARHGLTWHKPRQDVVRLPRPPLVVARSSLRDAISKHMVGGRSRPAPDLFVKLWVQEVATFVRGTGRLADGRRSGGGAHAARRYGSRICDVGRYWPCSRGKYQSGWSRCRSERPCRCGFRAVGGQCDRANQVVHLDHYPGVRSNASVLVVGVGVDGVLHDAGVAPPVRDIAGCDPSSHSGMAHGHEAEVALLGCVPGLPGR